MTSLPTNHPSAGALSDDAILKVARDCGFDRDSLTKIGPFARTIEAALLAAFPAPLSDAQVATLEEATTKLENIGHIFAGDKQSRRLAKELHALLAAVPALVNQQLEDEASQAASDKERLKQLEHALVYVAHSMHSEPQYMLAEGITLGDVSHVRVKIADIDVSVEIPESVARAMYDAARQVTATRAAERKSAYECCRQNPCVRPGQGPCDKPAQTTQAKAVVHHD